MGIDDLLQELQNREIKLQTFHGRLRAIGESRRLTEELKTELVRQRLELMVRLGKSQTPPLALGDQLMQAINHAAFGVDTKPVLDDIHQARKRRYLSEVEADCLKHALFKLEIPINVEAMPLSDFATSGLVREVYSEVLDETVVWAADSAVVYDTGGRVLYRARELQGLVGHTPEELRRIHAVKKESDFIEPDEGDVQIWEVGP